MTTPSEKRVPLTQFLTDSVLFGVGSMADRVIGFLFLPITASILGSAGFGVYNLYATASAILFMLCAVGMHSAYFRFATDDSAAKDPLHVLNIALAVIHVFTVAWIPPLLWFAAPLSDLLVGVREPWFVYWLCLRTYCDIIGSMADCKLQADGRLKLFLALRIPATIFVRAVSLGVLIHYRTPLALAAGEAAAALLATLPISIYVMRGARLQFDRQLTREMVRFGVTLIPGMVSAWLLVAANRYLLRALGPDQVRDVGLFSLVERYSSVMLLLSQALWLGWRRFAFRNIHLEDGAALLGRGATLYFATAGFGALAIAMLGPASVHLLIAPEFAPAAALIAPMTFSALLSALLNPLRMGLIKDNRTVTMSGIITGSAVVTMALAVLWIPDYASAGAVAASVAGQVVAVAATWVLAQRAFPIPYEVGRMAGLTLWLGGAYVAGRLLEPFGWWTVLLVGAGLLAALPFLLYRFGPFSQAERERIVAIAGPFVERLKRAGR